MQLVLEQEQEDLRAAVRAFAREEAPRSVLRAVVDGDHGPVPGLWRGLADRLDLVGLTVPASHGGSGAGHVERAVALEELGRALVPVPYLSCAVLAVDTLSSLADERARAELLPSIAAGERLVAVAVTENGRWDTEAVTTRAEPVSDDPAGGAGWVLTGRKETVLDGAGADVLLVLADTPDGPGFFQVDRDARGLTRTPLEPLDPTRAFARIGFDATPARRLTTPDARAALSRVRDLASVAVAAESLGVLAHALETAVEYAKVRIQFGRYIGSYQAVKHLCADSHVDLELSESVLRHAAWAADHAPGEFPVAAAHARLTVPAAAFRTAARAVEVLGGIGFTWEHDAHLYYKRARTLEHLLGDPSDAARVLADRLLPDTAPEAAR
ncbi:acyl-CoA dehydrogenase family protein [Nocardiopsis ganjiahuensis]|uniref:acyl-CoA dehydrogenase family protein n=1 Tax=Nocardiopsis ganjiahuensis TaxID=239984 RepID=UPI00034DDCEA|nr:acyl-CoA dehydrogenase family protein [Nocardiopsis ganjiahuensis]